MYEIERQLAMSAKMMENSLGSLKVYEPVWLKQIDAINHIARQIQDFSGAVNSSLSAILFRVQEYVEKINHCGSLTVGGAASPLQDLLDRVRDSSVVLHRSSGGAFEGFLSRTAIVGEEYSNLLTRYADELGIGSEGFELSIDENCSVDGKDIEAVSEIALSLDEIRISLFDGDGCRRPSPDYILEKIRSISSSDIKKAVLFLLLVFFSNFILGPFANNCYNAVVGGADIRAIQKIIRGSGFSSDFYSVASHSMTAVGEDNSFVVGKVKRGQVVYEICCAKKEVFVEFTDVDGKTVRGWVPKKYVKPVVPRKKRKPETKRNDVRINS
ncbi:MAG: hypothetical protein B193_0130 [Solidesulfovibrio magneticus str. Maddingley MBC34]|uniref:Uncharacterized protein n=1 Tax=Solidesulfovibrio magneticus str. Maddingley MBC34 TaxID=1206767 RepID=K6GJ66_9BACT|nr:MAG: hypothetical protein B193_0130 [Solidesulfovibrio magneticus str. Maddingley MBC34]